MITGCNNIKVRLKNVYTTPPLNILHIFEKLKLKG